MPVPSSSIFEDQAVGHNQRYLVTSGPRMLAGVDQALAHDGEGVVAHVLRHGVVHGSLEAHLGTAPKGGCQLVREVDDGLAQAAGQRGIAQLEDGRTDLRNGVVELVDGLCDPLDDQVEFGQPRSTLEAHADGVDALDDPVVEIPGDAVPIVEHAHDTDPVVQSRVLNGDARGQCKGLGECLVLVAESGRTLLVSEVEVAVDVIPYTHRDPQERRHRRVTRRKPVTARVLFEMVEAKRFGFGDQQPQHAAARWAVPDHLLFSLTEADGDELLEPGAGLVEDSQGGVAGTDERPGLSDQVGQQIGQFDVGGDHEYRSHETPELLGVVHPRIGHRAERTADSQKFRGHLSRAGRMTR